MILTTPLNTIPSEQSFSLLNCIKTKFRNKLNDISLDELMNIALNDVEMENAPETFFLSVNQEFYSLNNIKF